MTSRRLRTRLRTESKRLIFNLSFALVYVFFTMYVYNYVWLNKFDKIQLKQYEFAIDKLKITQKDSLQLDLNNKLNLLQSKIEKVELANDKRFEILGWSFGMMCSLVLIILLLNYVNSKTAIKDLIRDEIDKIDEKRESKINILITSLEEANEFYNSEKNSK